MASSSNSNPNSNSHSLPEHLKVDCLCGVRSPLRTALTDANVGRRFLGCVNYDKGPGIACEFFEWVDPATCKRGKEFGQWIVKKNRELKKKEQELGAEIRQLKEREHEYQRREEWFAVKVCSMNKEMKEIEAGLKLKLEDWQKREDFYKLNMEEVEAKNLEMRLRMEYVEAKNVVLRKSNKAMKEEVELEKWKVKVLSAMVLAMLAILVVVFCGEKIWKKKMLALP